MDLSVLGGTRPAPEQARVEEEAPEAEVLEAVFEPSATPGVSKVKSGRRRRLQEYISAKTDEGREMVDHAIAAMRNPLLSPRDQARAREFLADRLFGKTVSVSGAVQHKGRVSVEHSGAVAEVQTSLYDLARLSDEDLASMEALARKALAAPEGK